MNAYRFVLVPTMGPGEDFPVYAFGHDVTDAMERAQATMAADEKASPGMWHGWCLVIDATEQ